MRKRIRKTKYFAVFVTSLLIFIIGLLIGSYTTSQKLEQIQDLEHSLRMDTMAMELQYLFLSSTPCQATNTTTLTDDLYTIGEKLNYMENSLGSDDPEVINLKDYYSLLEIRHYLFQKQILEECNQDLVLILYFYSPDKRTCDRCVEQGYALTYLRKENDNVRVYSFDTEISNPALDAVKQTYLKRNELPALVIGDSTYYGFKDKNALTELISNESAAI